jgi:phosphopentomutase
MDELKDDKKLKDKLNELVKEVGGMSDIYQSKLVTLAQQARDSQRKLKKSVDNLQESLDYLRVCIKYQLFDLEATRRENKYLRKMLEERES